MYVKEYMLEQEHLSLIRFFHSTITDYMKPNSHVPRKWCIFSRTNAELLRLSSDAHLQGFLQPSSSTKFKVDIIELSSIPSLYHCEVLVESAFTSHNIVSETCNTTTIIIDTRDTMLGQHGSLHFLSSEPI